MNKWGLSVKFDPDRFLNFQVQIYFFKYIKYNDGLMTFVKVHQVAIFPYWNMTIKNEPIFGGVYENLF